MSKWLIATNILDTSTETLQDIYTPTPSTVKYINEGTTKTDSIHALGGEGKNNETTEIYSEEEIK
jgi:hypothetical protein